LFQYKVSVCDIQISVDLINLTGWQIYSWLCTVTKCNIHNKISWMLVVLRHPHQM
jgi:hypothetical protein